jgi:hypothetical protein
MAGGGRDHDGQRNMVDALRRHARFHHADTDLSGIFMGLGIVAMHYTAMQAMQAHAELSYDRLFVLLSLTPCADGAPTWRRRLAHSCE